LFLQPISRTLSIVGNAVRSVKTCSFGRGRKTERREERKRDVSKRQKESSKKRYRKMKKLREK